MDECMKLLIEQNQGLNDELIRVRADAYRMEMENFHLKRQIDYFMDRIHYLENKLGGNI